MASESTEITLTSYAEVREALRNSDLVRSLDWAKFERGNILEGVVLVLEGSEHRERRRVENALFRRDNLANFESAVFPRIIQETLDTFSPLEGEDLVSIGALMSVALSARVAGIDIEETSVEERLELVEYVHTFAEGLSIDAARTDVDRVRERVQQGLKEFGDRYLRASLSTEVKGSSAAPISDAPLEDQGQPDDVLGVLLENRDELDLDDAQILREVALYVEAGSHTSSQTLTNTLHFIFGLEEDDPDLRYRLVEDRAAVQRFVHEALRLRPTNPKIKRRAKCDTRVGNISIEKGTILHLDTATANRDVAVYGVDAEEFDPWREISETAPRYGLSFGGGLHSCIGRALAVGMSIPGEPDLPAHHLFGIVTLMVQELLRRGVVPSPEGLPIPDKQTDRWSRWEKYPVVFERIGGSPRLEDS